MLTAQNEKKQAYNYFDFEQHFWASSHLGTYNLSKMFLWGYCFHSSHLRRLAVSLEQTFLKKMELKFYFACFFAVDLLGVVVVVLFVQNFIILKELNFFGFWIW